MWWVWRVRGGKVGVVGESCVCMRLCVCSLIFVTNKFE